MIVNKKIKMSNENEIISISKNFDALPRQKSVIFRPLIAFLT